MFTGIIVRGCYCSLSSSKLYMSFPLVGFRFVKIGDRFALNTPVGLTVFLIPRRLKAEHTARPSRS